MIRPAIVLLALAIPFSTTAFAQELPALFDVQDVAEGDVLSVRTRPMGTSTVIGTYAHDATGIEVVSREGDWALVNVDGSSGWAKSANLVRVDRSALPEALRFDCFGTEPFWSLEVTRENSAIFSTPETSSKAFRLGPITTANARPHPHALLGSAPGENITIVVDRQMCSDGMSDHQFGLSGTVVMGGYDMQVYSGCCSVQPD